MKSLTLILNVPLGSPTADTETDLAAFIEDVKEMKTSVQALNMLMHFWKMPEIIINLVIKIRHFVNLLTQTINIEYDSPYPVWIGQIT